jgi:hypothetical protein
MQPKSPKTSDTRSLFDPSSMTDHYVLDTTPEPSRLGATTESVFFDRNWKAPFLLIWLIASLPVVSYSMWRALSDLRNNDWISLASRTRRLHKLGFTTRTTRYWLAISYSNLNQWVDAVELFETMSRPLESVADDAARYCAHVWALANLGRVEEASELLIHTIQEDWPVDRRNWAGHFLEKHAEPGTAEFMLGTSTTLLH